MAVRRIQASRVSVSFVGHTAHCGTESEHQVLIGSHIFISFREYWHYLVLSSNIHVKREKMMRENNPVRLTFDSWCSLSVPQCATTYLLYIVVNQPSIVSYLLVNWQKN